MKRGLLIVAILAVAPPALIAAPAPPRPAQTPAATPPATQQALEPMSEEKRVDADAIEKHLADGKTLLLDVREAKELEELGTIEGALHIPLGQLEKRLAEIPKDRLILTA